MAQHLQERSLPRNVRLLLVDVAGQKVNTFTAEVIREFADFLAEISRQPDVRGLIVASGKPGQFFAGADLHDLADPNPAAHVRWTSAILDGNRLMTVLSELPFPTVTLINGACLGGGAELALATDFRVVADEPQVKIGLPEVTLGLIPGWGGTQRLPRLVELGAALEMIVTGQPVDARRAADIGLVDAVVPADRLLDAGLARIEDMQQSQEWRAMRQQRRQPLTLSEEHQSQLFSAAEAGLLQKSPESNSAPWTAFRVVRDGVVVPLEDGLALERTEFLHLVGSPVSTKLITEFFNTSRRQRSADVQEAGNTPRALQTVGEQGARMSEPRTNPFLGHLQLPPVTVSEQVARLEFTVEAIHLRHGGVVHGGLLAAVLDSVSGYAAYEVAPPGTDLVSVQLNLNLTATARLGDRLTATARVQHAGRRTAVVQGEIRRGDGKLVALGSVTVFFIAEGLT